MREIDEKTFKALLPGSRMIAGNEGGTTYKSEDGHMFARIHDGTDWQYVIIAQ